ncbi:MAG: hypothetical protein H8E42_02990 [Nitrospinae bacterium]|nr:hypothetical protein [Nitrospinota bacterium]MBL7020449.1 hypothetical protein [Nitrospinaceae bacterium]
MATKPLKVVMIRRGTSKVSNVPSENLVTFIRKKVLLGTDELSGDGDSWTRVDRHYQLRKYFLSNETGETVVADSRPDDSVKLNPPPGLKGELEEMAGLLKDING